MTSKTEIMRAGEYKRRAVKMQLKLRDQQLKTITHIQRFLYINVMVTTKQKSVIDTHRKNPKKNPNITLKITIKSQGKITEEEKRKMKELQK